MRLEKRAQHISIETNIKGCSGQVVPRKENRGYCSTEKMSLNLLETMHSEEQSVEGLMTHNFLKRLHRRLKFLRHSHFT